MKEFLQILRRFVPPYKKYLVWSVVFNILSALLNIFSFAALIPLLQILFKVNTGAKATHVMALSDGSLKDVLANNADYYTQMFIADWGPTTTLLIIGLIMGFMTFLKTGAYFLSSASIIPVRTGVVCDIRNQLYKKITSLSLSFFSEERKGDIIARMSGDVQEVDSSVMSSLDLLFKNPILVLIYFITLMVISWQLTIFTLLFVPLFASFMGIVGRKLKQGTIMIIVVLWFGGTLVLGESPVISGPTFIYYLVILYSILNPLKEISKAGYSIAKGLASMERIDKILMAENTIKEVEQPKHIEAFNRQIEFRNVSFAYDTIIKEDGTTEPKWVLRNINLIIPKGKTIALVGQSGSGKSTLLDLIPRYYDVQEGEILIDGINIKELAIHDLRHLIGNVNQEAILFNDTFKNNISFGVVADDNGIVEAAKIANAHDFISQTEKGYETNIGDRGGRLSGGQRQRVSIARAILKNPPILILDEATSALDTESERLVQDALYKLMKTRTTIAVAHRLSTIKNSDEICVMHEGEIVERGTHDKLMQLNGYYKKLHDMQEI